MFDDLRSDLLDFYVYVCVAELNWIQFDEKDTDFAFTVCELDASVSDFDELAWFWLSDASPPLEIQNNFMLHPLVCEDFW